MSSTIFLTLHFLIILFFASPIIVHFLALKTRIPSPIIESKTVFVTGMSAIIIGILLFMLERYGHEFGIRSEQSEISILFLYLPLFIEAIIGFALIHDTNHSSSKIIVFGIILILALVSFEVLPISQYPLLALLFTYIGMIVTLLCVGFALWALHERLEYY